MKKNNIGIILLILLLTTGCGKESIIGNWKSTGTKDEYFFNFNKDKTCSYEMKAARLDCTYEIDEKKITILYKGSSKPNTFKYKIEKNILIITDDNNKNNKFIKQK